MSDPWRNR